MGLETAHISIRMVADAIIMVLVVSELETRLSDVLFSQNSLAKINISNWSC